MKNHSRAVFFDVDGVLVDSLAQHLSFCGDMAREYGLTRITIPDVIQFRGMVSSGIPVSPMLNLFLAVGFPQAMAELAVLEYARQFMVRYRPLMFAGVEQVLARLQGAGVTLGLVTANLRAHVDPVLQSVLRYFDPSCRFYIDSEQGHRSKASYLEECLRVLGTESARCTYVGDQPADARAAREAHMAFVGVTFGWGLVGGEQGLVLVDSVAAIADALLTQP